MSIGVFKITGNVVNSPVISKETKSNSQALSVSVIYSRKSKNSGIDFLCTPWVISLTAEGALLREIFLVSEVGIKALQVYPWISKHSDFISDDNND